VNTAILSGETRDIVSSDNLLRVLTLFDSSEEAEALINVLRNAGHIVRDIRVEDDEDMRAALDEHPLDLVLARPKLPLLSAKQALEIMAASGRDLPLVIVTQPGDETSAVPLLHAGARDLVAMDQPERLKAIVNREVADLKARRDHRRCEKMLRETEKRARDLIDSSRDAIAYVHDGMHIYANSAYLKMFGYDSQDDIQGVPIMDMVSSEDNAHFKDFLRKYAKGDTSESTLEVHGRQVDGRKFKITMEFSPASMEGEACTQIIIRDQTLSQELEKKLSVLSKQDLLTGLYNRAYFLEQVDHLVSRAVEGKSRGALLYIYLDGYKGIKDNIGISGGDLFLADVANLLKSKLGETGLLARFEGEVFTLLLEKVDAEHAEKLAKGICKLVEDYFSEVGGQTVRTTASIGISLINETAGNGQRSLLNAEKACESVREAGGNGHILHNPAVAGLAEQEKLLHWSQKIKDALQNNQFQLLYQPIVSLHGEEGENYEVLVRLLDEHNNEVEPSEFMPAAEHAGLMLYIDRWVLANAFKILSDRLQSGTKTRLFVKLSGGSLTDDQFIPWVSERIKALRLHGEYIVFAINESTALNHLKRAQEVIAGLKQLHCRFALDRFGTEPNTFDSVKHLDVDYLKLDQSLNSNLATNVETQERVKTISEHARTMGKRTIAAFVEDANSLAVLWQCSVDYIQGYFLRGPTAEMDYDFTEDS